jgi:hypothetical protein
MSDDIKHIDVDSEEWENTPKTLRDQVKKLQDALSKEREASASLRSTAAESALGGVLAGFKNPGRVKRDLLSDGIDPLDSEAVETWMKDNGDDYARGSTEPAPPEQPEPATDLQGQWDRLQIPGSQNPAALEKTEAVFSEITPDMDGAAVEALFRSRGL